MARLAAAAGGIAEGLSLAGTTDFSQAVPIISRDDDGWLVTSNFKSVDSNSPVIFETGSEAADPYEAWLNIKYQNDQSKFDQRNKQQKSADINEYKNSAVLIVDQQAFSPNMSDDIIAAYGIAHKVLVHCTDGKLRVLKAYPSVERSKFQLLIFYDSSGSKVAGLAYDTSMPAAFAKLATLPMRQSNLNVISFYGTETTRRMLQKFHNAAIVDSATSDFEASVRAQLKRFQNQTVFALFHNEDGQISLLSSVNSSQTHRVMSLKRLDEIARDCCNVKIFPLACKASSYSRLIGFNVDLDAPLMLQRLYDASEAATQAQFLSRLSSNDAILVIDATDFVKQGQVIAKILVYNRQRHTMIVVGTVAIGSGSIYFYTKG